MKSPVMYGKLLLGAALALYLPLSHAAPTYSFTQYDMYTSDWNQVVERTAPAHSTSWFAQPFGGNNDSWLAIGYQHAASNAAYSDTIIVSSVFRNYAYTPWYFGAVDEISISFDAKGFNSTFPNASTAFLYPIIQQDGVVYSVSGSGYAAITVGDWSTYRFNYSATDNWVSLNSADKPDFSTNGSDITFGVRFGMLVSCPGSCNSISTTTGLDNFSYSVYAAPAVPEPSSYALMLAGLAVTAAYARKRRQALQG